MFLQLNDQVVPYKEFYGTNIVQMPLLVKDGRVPMSVAGLIDRRLEVIDAKFLPEIRAAWHNNDFETGDAVLYNPNGKVKIVTDAQVLRGINSASELSDGALVLQPGVYEAAQGAEFTKADLKKIIKDSLTRDEAKSNPFWQALARNQDRLNAYVDFVFNETQRRFSHDKNMGLYLEEAQKEPTARLLYVDGLKYKSYADGRFGLDDDGGRLVGVAPEARTVQKMVAKDLEHRV